MIDCSFTSASLLCEVIQWNKCTPDSLSLPYEAGASSSARAQSGQIVAMALSFTVVKLRLSFYFNDELGTSNSLP